VTGERIVQLAEIEGAVYVVEQRDTDEHEERGHRGENEDLEGCLKCERSFQEESGEPVAGKGCHLEPDEQVDGVGGERRADECGE
jgi:hypothetical protein